MKGSRWWCLVGVHSYQVFEAGSYERHGVLGKSNGRYYRCRCEVCGRIKLFHA